MQLSLTSYGRDLLKESSFSESLRALPRDPLESLFGDEFEKIDQLETTAEKIIEDTNRLCPLREAAWQALSLCRKVNDDFYGAEKLSGDLSQAPLILPLMLFGKQFFEQDIDLQVPLGKAVTASVIESCRHYDPNYSWNTTAGRNFFSLSIHGDLTVQQSIAPPHNRNPTLFEQEATPPTTFDRHKHTKSFTIYQDASTFLLAILDYARRTGHSDLHEIVNWKTVVKEVKPISTNTAEAFGGTLDSLSAKFLRSTTLLDESGQRELSPIMISTQRSESSPVAAFLDGRLTFLAGNSAGDVKVNSPWCAYAPRFSKILSFGEEDLPQLMRATLKLFARDRTCMSWLLTEFPKGNLFISSDKALAIDQI